MWVQQRVNGGSYVSVSLPTQYATLICAKADDFGNVEICNGGHPAPLHVKTDGITAIKSSTVPLGLFCEQQFQSTRIRLQPGDSLVVYTDGLTESLGPDGSEYGEDRLTKLLSARNGHNCRQLLEASLGRDDAVEERLRARTFFDSDG